MYFLKFLLNSFRCSLSHKFIIMVEAGKIHRVLKVPDTQIFHAPGNASCS